MTQSFVKTRDKLETYFDRTASKAWEVLTTDRPVSGIRAKVRAGRNEMKRILLDAFPDNLDGSRILDAGCGTGQIASELAQRGATVLGVDISNSLIEVARKRLPTNLQERVEFKVGDMLAKDHGNFDYIVSMDSLIHYQSNDIVGAIDILSKRTKEAIFFTIAPETLILSTLLLLGKVLPRADRSPRIAPTSFKRLLAEFEKKGTLDTKKFNVIKRVNASFYVSEAVALRS
jgi:magnesium-protoporphyrin O-methyltransferase